MEQDSEPSHLPDFLEFTDSSKTQLADGELISLSFHRWRKKNGQLLIRNGIVSAFEHNLACRCDISTWKYRRAAKSFNGDLCRRQYCTLLPLSRARRCSGEVWKSTAWTVVQCVTRGSRPFGARHILRKLCTAISRGKIDVQTWNERQSSRHLVPRMLASW